MIKCAVPLLFAIDVWKIDENHVVDYWEELKLFHIITQVIDLEKKTNIMTQKRTSLNEHKYCTPLVHELQAHAIEVILHAKRKDDIRLLLDSLLPWRGSVWEIKQSNHHVNISQHSTPYCPENKWRFLLGLGLTPKFEKTPNLGFALEWCDVLMSL